MVFNRPINIFCRVTQDDINKIIFTVHNELRNAPLLTDTKLFASPKTQVVLEGTAIELDREQVVSSARWFFFIKWQNSKCFRSEFITHRGNKVVAHGQQQPLFQHVIKWTSEEATKGKIQTQKAQV